MGNTTSDCRSRPRNVRCSICWAPGTRRSGCWRPATGCRPTPWRPRFSPGSTAILERSPADAEAMTRPSPQWMVGVAVAIDDEVGALGADGLEDRAVRADGDVRLERAGQVGIRDVVPGDRVVRLRVHQAGTQLEGAHRRNRPAAVRTVLAFEELLESCDRRGVVFGLRLDWRVVQRPEPAKREVDPRPDNRDSHEESDPEKHCVHWPASRCWLGSRLLYPPSAHAATAL